MGSDRGLGNGMRVGLCLAALATSLGAHAAPTTVDDIRACTQKNVVDLASLRNVESTTTNRDGSVQTLRLKLLWKPGAGDDLRMNLSVVDPEELADSAFLLVQEKGVESAFFYLPAGRKTTQLVGQDQSRPLWGTDFSYGEFKQVQGLLVGGSAQRMGDGSIAGRPTYVLETKTSLADTGYTRIVSHVDQKTCVLLRSEFFGKAADSARKRLDADVNTLTTTADHAMAMSYTMQDLREGSRTRLNLSDYLPAQMTDLMFEPETFAGQD